ncbi:hypothetical protein SAMN04488508_106199 [Aquimarina spongiae]|uniref:Uncharacterized protein n=2 Tax=Aquimarina spongiae TaxID=570521 RepID=A0A1M6HC41_9FLAO|nr:hypothetical protein SAMN04488508_106199 [Aquimarina spongiae]
MKVRPLQQERNKNMDSRAFPKRMIPWKQALVTALGVYPLLLSYEWVIAQVLPVQEMDRRITLLIIVVMIATTMVFLVMPMLIKILGSWLFQKTIKTNRK